MLKFRCTKGMEDSYLRYYFLAFFVLILDQVTKWLVVKYMELGESIPLWKDVFHLTSHRNAGAAFGILQNQRWFFIGVTLFIVVGLIVYLRRTGSGQPILSIGLGLVLGGAFGNFIDRFLFGEVVDFLHFVLINFPIFNVADSAITVGVGLIILDTLFDMKKTKKEENI